MPDGKGCYTPIGDTGIHLKRYWDDGSWLRVHGSWLRGNVVMTNDIHDHFQFFLKKVTQKFVDRNGNVVPSQSQLQLTSQTANS